MRSECKDHDLRNKIRRNVFCFGHEHWQARLVVFAGDNEQKSESIWGPCLRLRNNNKDVIDGLIIGFGNNVSVF